MAFLLTCFGGDDDNLSCVAVVAYQIYKAMVLAHVMPCDSRFLKAPSSCASAPLYMIGFGRVLPSANGLLTE